MYPYRQANAPLWVHVPQVGNPCYRLRHGENRDAHFRSFYHPKTIGKTTFYLESKAKNALRVKNR